MNGTFSYTRPIYYVADGDSRTAPEGPAGVKNWFWVASGGEASTGNVAKNYGVGFKTLAQIVSGYSGTGAASLSVSGGHQWSPAVTGARGIYFVFGGTNDLVAGTSAATCLGYLQTLYANARTDGYSLIVGFTEPMSTLLSSGQETERKALNTSLRALTLGGSNTPDILVDADQLLSGAKANSGLYDGGTPWYADEVHLSVTGSRLLGRVAKARLNQAADPYSPLTVIWPQSQTTPFTTGDTVKLDNFQIVHDPASLFDRPNSVYQCLQSGLVEITAQITHVIAAVGDEWHLSAWVTHPGGSPEVAGHLIWANDQGTPTHLVTHIGSTVLPVEIGDVLDLRIAATAGTNGWNIFNYGEPLTRVVFRYLPTP